MKIMLRKIIVIIIGFVTIGMMSHVKIFLMIWR